MSSFSLRNYKGGCEKHDNFGHCNYMNLETWHFYSSVPRAIYIYVWLLPILNFLKVEMWYTLVEDHPGGLARPPLLAPRPPLQAPRLWTAVCFQVP